MRIPIDLEYKPGTEVPVPTPSARAERVGTMVRVSCVTGPVIGQLVQQDNDGACLVATYAYGVMLVPARKVRVL